MEPRPFPIAFLIPNGPLSRARGQSGQANMGEVDSRENPFIHGGVCRVACGCVCLLFSSVCDALCG